MPNHVTEIPRSLSLLDTRIPFTSGYVPPPENIIRYLPWWQDESYCPICFSGIKRRRSATSTHSTMASRLRPTRSEPCTYGWPAFEPSRLLLRCVFFLNDEKSRYVSVGFYPSRNYQPLVKFGGTRFQPLVLPADYVNIVVERLPGLVEAMCLNDRFVWRSENKVFKMNSKVTYSTARFIHDKHWISL